MFVANKNYMQNGISLIHKDLVFEESSGRTYEMLVDCRWYQYTAEKKFSDIFNFVKLEEDANKKSILVLVNTLYDLRLFENKMSLNPLNDKFAIGERVGWWRNKGKIITHFTIK